MALPTYSASQHHIGLQASGGTNYGFMLEGGYAKEMQREALGAPDLGGATDLIGQTPSLSRWTQDDFVGGMFGYSWGRDDAMFADCTGFIPGQQSRSLFSVPPIVLKKAIDSDTQTGFLSDTPKSMFMVGGDIYIGFTHAIAKYAIDSDTLSWTTTSALGQSNYRFASVEWNQTDQRIWAVAYDYGLSAGTPIWMRIKTDLTLTTYDPFYTGPTRTAGLRVYGGTIFNQKLVMQAGRKLWVGDPPDDPDPDVTNDNVRWTKIGVLPGRWFDSIAYNGMIYILTNDGAFRSNIWAFDGDALLPIAQLPFSFYGKCMIEYAGRIFVGGTGTDVNGTEHYAELYEVTGASVRLVRSFSPETRYQIHGGLAGEWPRTIDDMGVHEGMLWFAQKGKRWMAYDITSDGFFGASEFQSLATLEFAKFVTGRGRIWGYGVDSSTDANHGIYRIGQPNNEPMTAWNPTFVTSDFNYEPGMLKRWSQIDIQTKYGGVTSLEYSLDAGHTWTSLSGTSSNTNSKVYHYTCSLAGIAASRLVRFRIKLSSTSPEYATTYHRELIAFTVSYAMLDTGKLSWGLTVNGSDEIERVDVSAVTPTVGEGTTQAYTPSEVRDQLWSWATDKTALTFTDVSGSTYNVNIVSIRETHPVIGHPASDEREAFYALTLMEV